MPRWKLALACVTLAGAVQLVVLGCSPTEPAKPTASAANPAPAATANPVDSRIEPRADAALKRMSQTLAAQKSFRVHSTATIEEEMESGQVVQVLRDAVITLSRPSGFHAEVHYGSDIRRVWHQGTDLTIFDVKDNQYAVLETPEKIDDMLDFLAEERGIIIPLDDLLYTDPYEGLTDNALTGVFVDQQEIGGRLCDHLLFTQENVDWQIWIDTATQAVPRRVVITYKDDLNRHQFEANLTDWQLGLALDASAFKPSLPASATKVEISEIEPLDEQD